MSAVRIVSVFFSKLGKSTTARSAVLTLLLGSVLTKAVAFARESITARAYGVSAEYDMFLLVFMIPSAVFSTLNYSISYALVPYYHQQRSIIGVSGAFRRATAIAIISVLGSCVIPLCAMLLGPWIVRTVLIPKSRVELDTATALLYTLIWMVPLYTAISLVQTILLAERRFVAQAVGPLVQNLLIAGVLIVVRDPGVMLLADLWIIGLIGWLVSVLLHYWRLRREILGSEEQCNDHLTRSAGIALVGTAAQVLLIELWPQLYVVMDRFVVRRAGFESGSIAALGYAYTIYSMLLSFVVSGVGQAVFPFMSSLAASAQTAKLEILISKGMRWLILTTIPLAVLIGLNSREIVSVIYEHGAFNRHATEMTGTGLGLYACALAFDSAYVIFVAYFYAVRDFRTLTQGAVIAFAAKAIAILLLAHGMGYLALAVSTVFAASVRSFYVGLRLRNTGIRLARCADLGNVLWKTFLAAGLAASAAIMVTHYLLPSIGPLVTSKSFGPLCTFIANSCIVVISYAAIARWLRIPEAVNIFRGNIFDLRPVGGG